MSAPALSAAFTPPTLGTDGKIAAVNVVLGGDGGRAELWQTFPETKLLTKLGGHRETTEVTFVDCWPRPTRAGQVGVTRDKWRIVTASGEPSARVWDMDGNQKTKVMTQTGNLVDWDILWAGFTPDGKNIVTASASTLDPVENDPNSIDPLQAPPATSHPTRLGWLQMWNSSDGRSTMDVNWEGTWIPSHKRIDGLMTARAVHIFGSPGRIFTAALQRDRDVLDAGGSYQYTIYKEQVRVWTLSLVRGRYRLNGGTELTAMSGTTAADDGEEGINQINLSSVNDLLVVSSDRGTATVYQEKSGTWQKKAVLKGETMKGVLAADFAPDPAYLATASVDGRVRVWGWQQDPAKPLATLPGPGTDAAPPVAVTDVRFRWDGRQFVATYEDGSAWVYERKDGTSPTPKWGSWERVVVIPPQ